MRDRQAAVAIQLPIGERLPGIVDLVRHTYNNDQGTDIEETDIPAEGKWRKNIAQTD